MGYADVTGLYGALLARFAVLGHPWPITYGHRARWQQNDAGATVGGYIVMHAGTEDGDAGSVQRGDQMVFDPGPSMGRWAQLCSFLVTGVGAEPDVTDELADDRQALCITSLLLGAIEDVIPTAGHSFTIDRNPVWMRNPRQLRRGATLGFTIAVDFAVRRADGYSLITTLTPAPRATVQADDDGTDATTITDHHS